MSLKEQIQTAISAHQSGQLKTALALYWRILGLAPRLAGVWHLAGAAALQCGELVKAIGCFQHALELAPGNSEHYHCLGDALRLAGRRAEALEAYQSALCLEETRVDSLVAAGNLAVEEGAPAAAYFRRALAAEPNSAEALLGLGNVRLSEERLPAARALFSQAVSLAPGLAAAHTGLGHALLRGGEAALSLPAYRNALELEPESACHCRHLAAALLAAGQVEEALPVAARAVELAPLEPSGHELLAGALSRNGRAPEAAACLRRRLEVVAASPQFREELEALFRSGATVHQALEHVAASLRIAPGDVAAANRLGIACRALGRIRQAQEAFQIGLDAWPGNASLLINYGALLALTGRAEEAEQLFQRAAQAAPDNPEPHKVRLFTRHYHPGAGAAALVAAHRDFGRWFAQRHPGRGRHYRNEPSPQRRLRIGYLSADFRDHAVAQFLKPLYQARDQARFHVSSYSNSRIEDHETRAFRAASDQWRHVPNLADDELERLIQSDGIDILVDLTGFTQGNRFEVLARRPAPVQALYLGYFATTGTGAIDHYITDSIADPPGAERNYTERLLRLPGCAWCYAPLPGAPEPAPPPALRSGAFTYGCLNNPAKYNHAVLALWARILERVPSARLLAHCGWDEEARAVLLGRFAAAGVDPARVTLQGKQSYSDYLASYSQVDLALDPFPYNGGATTCDALWMGVPAVTLSGELFSGRIGTSLLHHAGVTGFAASTPDEYVALAAGWAERLPELAELRRGMRTRMHEAGFLDQKLFMRGLEAAYRRIWAEWCAARAPAQAAGVSMCALA